MSERGIDAGTEPRALFRWQKDDAYTPWVEVRPGGSVRIGVGGYVVERPLREWHRLAFSPPTPAADPGEAPQEDDSDVIDAMAERCMSDLDEGDDGTVIGAMKRRAVQRLIEDAWAPPAEEAENVAAFEHSRIRVLSESGPEEGACCAAMTTHLVDDDGVVEYRKHHGEYVIPVPDSGSSGIVMDYCPWCGTRLPASRREEE